MSQCKVCKGWPWAEWSYWSGRHLCVCEQRRPRLESGSWQWRGCTTSAEEWIPGTWASSTTGYPRGVYVPPRGRSPFGAWYIQRSYQGPLCLPCDEPTGVDECTALDALGERQ